MKVLVVLCAALAVACGEPAAVGYAYSAAAPAIGYPFAPHAYGYGYSPLAYSAAPVVTPFAAAPIKSQYHSQDEFGQASYGHAEPTQSHNAVQDAAGNKVGSFSFVNPEGKLVRTDYVADALGYRVASNDLPAAPVVAPVAPVDTPEVAAAKAAHFAEVAKASSQSRKRRAIAYPYAAYPYAAYPHAYSAAAYPYAAYPHAYPTTHTVPVVTADGFLADTPEVAAAKANHFAEHAAAHARGKRSAFITPAATTPLVAAAPYVAPYSPIAYSAAAAYPYSTAYPYAAYPHAYPTTHTVPVVTADGFLADTPEVAAAKANHFAEHAAAHARGKRSAFITPAATTPLVAAAPYVAPYSPIAYSAAAAYPYSNAYPYSTAYPYSAYPYSAYPYSAYPYSAFYKK